MDAALNKKALLHSPCILVSNAVNQANADASSWKAFKKGSRSALNFIFEKYVRILYSYGSSITSDTALVADCIQDVFFELWTKREVVADDVKLVKFYLIKSLRRKIVRRLSEDKRSLHDAADHYSDEVEFSVEFSLSEERISKELSVRLDRAVSSLSKRQREAIYLKFYQNMSYEHIASAMNTNVKAIYNLIGKSVVSLRKVLKRTTLLH